MANLILISCLLFVLSIIPASSWNPLGSVPSKLLSRSAAGLLGLSITSNLHAPATVSFGEIKTGLHYNFIAHAQDVQKSIFDGNYNDPFHPDCLRKIKSDGDVITIVGSDNPSNKPLWRLVAKERVPGQILVDFSPKGGPKDLLGVYSTDINGIKWPDGNSWTKK